MSDELLALAYREAHLLDTWQLDEWRALFAPDGHYWLPIDENGDPARTASIAYDDVHSLAIRVEQLMRQDRISQRPRSETIHFITNFTVESESTASAVVNYHLLITELRTGDWRQRGLGEIHQYPGRVRLELVRIEGDWKIREKRLILLARNRPLEGLSFIL